jgi:hypothetical protein
MSREEIMNTFKSLIVVGAIAATAIIANTSGVQAAGECQAQPINPTNIYTTDKNFDYDTKTVTANFKVVGDAGCKTDVTFASWEAPSRSGYPLDQQELYDYKTGSFGVGTHTLTVKLPQCYWQIDLLPGNKPTAEDGTADYGFGKVQLLDTAHGGEKPCEDEPVAPVTPEKPAEPAKPAEVTNLPNTGAGAALAGLFGIGTSAGAAHSYIQSRRKLRIVK